MLKRLSRATRSPELRVVLELSPEADGEFRGQVDGVPISLGADGRVRIPLASGWPGAMVSVPEPEEIAVDLPAVRIRSRHPGWMSAALSRALSNAELRAALEGLPAGAVRADLRDDALAVSLSQDMDGPSVRRGIRALAALARALPTAMTDVVSAGVADDLALRGRTAPRPASAPRDAPEDRLSTQYDRFTGQLGRRLYATIFGVPVVMFAAVFLGGWARLRGDFVVLGGFVAAVGTFAFGMMTVRRLRFTAPCPRCGKARSTSASQIADDPRCPNCGLFPRRAPRFYRPTDVDPN